MEIFHVLSRGVDKRKIFIDDHDYFRFIHNLFEFNDEASAENNYRRFRKSDHMSDIQCRSYGESPRERRKLLVDIHAFSLMPNHYHMIVSANSENAIPRFMKKVNMGYSKYFNERYERKGTLFEGRYKSVPVTAQSHFIHLPYYIHLNPLDMFDYGWRERAVHNHVEAMHYLENYRWSSHLDYLGKKNFPSVTQREFLSEFFGGQEGYAQALDQWVKDISIENMQDVLLEK